MVKLNEVMPDINSTELNDNKNNYVPDRSKAVGRKRRAWLEGDDSIAHSDDTIQSISILNEITESQALPNKSLDSIKYSDDYVEQIISVNPLHIKRWEEKDRPKNELGDIEDLKDSFKNVGQQVPCVVRPIEDDTFLYELIIGECRWEAAKLGNLSLKVIVRNLDDHMASLAQAVENEKRQDLSEYAKGMSYAKKINKGFLSQKDLVEVLGISKQQVSRLLSFNKIPQEIADSIGDFRKVSSRTAEEICRYSKKGLEYQNLIKGLSEKIRNGKCGHNSINRIIKKHMEADNKKIQTNTKVYSDDGRHLFTWRLNNNNAPSIHFPNDIIKLIDAERLSFDDFNQEIKKWLTKNLTKLNS